MIVNLFANGLNLILPVDPSMTISCTAFFMLVDLEKILWQTPLLNK